MSMCVMAIGVGLRGGKEEVGGKRREEEKERGSPRIVSGLDRRLTMKLKLSWGRDGYIMMWLNGSKRASGRSCVGLKVVSSWGCESVRRVRAPIGHDKAFAGPGQHIDGDGTRNEGLCRRDEHVARPYDGVTDGHRASAIRHSRNGLHSHAKWARSTKKLCEVGGRGMEWRMGQVRPTWGEKEDGKRGRGRVCSITIGRHSQGAWNERNWVKWAE